MARVLAVLGCLLLAACNQLMEPEHREPAPDVRTSPDGVVSERRIGTIEHYGDPVRIEIPSSVQRGEGFTVKVRTYGGGCIGKGDTAVQVERRSAVVTPYDWEVVKLPPNWACTMELRVYEHTATLRFEEAGTAEVTIRGRRKPSGEVLQIRKTLEVR